MTCPYAHDDAAYVLGALSAAERRGYEQHLAACASCTRAVTDLAGLPGLLGRVGAETLADPANGPADPLPDTLLPALLGEVRRSGRRRTVATAGLAAAAAAVVVALGASGLVAGTGDPVHRPSTSASGALAQPSGTPMVATGAAPVRATIALRRTPWGTRLDMTCTYRDRAGTYPDPSESYVLVVRAGNGRTEQVASWRAVPGQSMQVTGTTAIGRDRIASVVVRTESGVPVLRLRT